MGGRGRDPLVPPPPSQCVVLFERVTTFRPNPYWYNLCRHSRLIQKWCQISEKSVEYGKKVLPRWRGGGCYTPLSPPPPQQWRPERQRWRRRRRPLFPSSLAAQWGARGSAKMLLFELVCSLSQYSPWVCIYCVGKDCVSRSCVELSFNPFQAPLCIDHAVSLSAHSTRAKVVLRKYVQPLVPKSTSKAWWQPCFLVFCDTRCYWVFKSSITGGLPLLSAWCMDPEVQGGRRLWNTWEWRYYYECNMTSKWYCHIAVLRRGPECFCPTLYRACDLTSVMTWPELSLIRQDVQGGCQVFLGCVCGPPCMQIHIHANTLVRETIYLVIRALRCGTRVTYSTGPSLRPLCSS